MTVRTSRLSLVVLAFQLVASPWAMGLTGRPCPGPLFDHPAYPVGEVPFSVATGDLDGDGDLDLVTANFHEGTISVLLNNGDGTFAADVKYEAGFEPASVAIGDLDDDGDLDLVVSSGGGADLNGYLPGTVSVLLNAGDGTFPSQTIHGLGIRPFSVALGDLDGDDDLDMAIAISGSDSVEIMFNNGDGTFVLGAFLPTGDFPGFIVIGDLNGDGDLDLAVTSWTQEVVSVYLNKGGVSFADRVALSLLFILYWLWILIMSSRRNRTRREQSWRERSSPTMAGVGGT